MDTGRRRLIQALCGLTLSASLRPAPALAAALPILTGKIPRTGEPLPAIGMGTWITFNVALFTEARRQCVEVLRNFFDLGGGLVDSSPMYGLSEATLGHALETLGVIRRCFPPPRCGSRPGSPVLPR